MSANENSVSGSDEKVKRPDRRVEGSIIPQEYLSQLYDLGLWLFAAPHCYNYGVRIYKPITAGGNGAPDYAPAGVVNLLEEAGEETLSPKSDAPALFFFQDPNDGVWIVYGVEGAGGLLPADFITQWKTAEEAIADIKDFYFGDPTRVNAKVEDSRCLNQRIEKSNREKRLSE